MATKNELIEIIFKSIDEINQQNDTHLIKGENAILFGKESDLDSLGLVNFIVNIEENINSKYNTSISINDEKAMSQRHSPFRSVDALSNYLMELLNEKL